MPVDIFDANYRHLGTADPREAHREGHWVRTFGCLVVSPRRRTALLQKKAPGLYPFDRPDHYDVTVGGHYEAGEAIEDGVREIREEIGLDIDFKSLLPLGVRQSAADLHEDYKLREFAHFFLLPLDRELREYPLPGGEVTGLVEIPIAKGTGLLTGRIDSFEAHGIFLTEGGDRRVLPTRVTRDSFYERVDDLFLRLFIVAGRYVSGEDRERLFL